MCMRKQILKLQLFRTIIYLRFRIRVKVQTVNTNNLGKDLRKRFQGRQRT